MNYIFAFIFALIFELYTCNDVDECSNGTTFVIQTRLVAIQDILLVDNCRSTNVLMEATTATTVPLAQKLMDRGPFLSIPVLVGNAMMSVGVLLHSRITIP